MLKQTFTTFSELQMGSPRLHLRLLILSLVCMLLVTFKTNNVLADNHDLTCGILFTRGVSKDAFFSDKLSSVADNFQCAKEFKELCQNINSHQHPLSDLFHVIHENSGPGKTFFGFTIARLNYIQDGNIMRLESLNLAIRIYDNESTGFSWPRLFSGHQQSSLDQAYSKYEAEHWFNTTSGESCSVAFDSTLNIFAKKVQDHSKIEGLMHESLTPQ